MVLSIYRTKNVDRKEWGDELTDNVFTWVKKSCSKITNLTNLTCIVRWS